MDELIKLSLELGLYDDNLNLCEFCKKESGWLTRISMLESKVTCDACYFSIFNQHRK